MQKRRKNSRETVETPCRELHIEWKKIGNSRMKMLIPLIYQVSSKSYINYNQYHYSCLNQWLGDVYWQPLLQDNPSISNYTSFSHNGSTFPATTTVTSGLINGNDLEGNHIVGTSWSIKGLWIHYILNFVNVLNDSRRHLEWRPRNKSKNGWRNEERS